MSSVGTWKDSYGQVLKNIHSPDACAREHCTIHNPSKHSMSELPQVWRSDRGYMERICPHGIGHPDPDEILPHLIHGCDGCCAPAEPELEAELIVEEDPLQLAYKKGGEDMKAAIMRKLDTGCETGDWALDVIEGRL